MWNSLLTRLGLKKEPQLRRFELTSSLETALVDLADQEQRPVADIQTDLLSSALSQRYTRDDLYQCWDALSPRQKDVIALTCLRYTNREMAAKLKIAPNTVKGYVRQVLLKFNMHSKDELRMLLRDWDFSAWGPEAQY